MKKSKLIFWMEIISILFIIISSYLLYLHYADTESFCDISQGFSCDIVNKSPYSEFPPGSGIPVSLIGIITFIVVIIALELIWGKKNKISKRALSSFVFYLMIISLLFALYLAYTELFLILSICILCVGQQAAFAKGLVLGQSCGLYRIWRLRPCPLRQSTL